MDPADADFEYVKKCVELTEKNKKNRENLWSTDLIDKVYSLIDNNSKIIEFNWLGRSLEAISKLYGKRIDSNYQYVVRTTNSLNTKFCTQHKKLCSHTQIDGDIPSKITVKQKYKMKKSKRKVFSILATCKESLNAPLDTEPFIDPTLAKINSTPGSTNSPNQLINCVLPTNDSILHLNTGASVEQHQVVDRKYLVPCTKLIGEDIPENLQLRPTLYGYQIIEANDNDMQSINCKQDLVPLDMNEMDYENDVKGSKKFMLLQEECDSEMEVDCERNLKRSLRSEGSNFDIDDVTCCKIRKIDVVESEIEKKLEESAEHSSISANDEATFQRQTDEQDDDDVNCVKNIISKSLLSFRNSVEKYLSDESLEKFARSQVAILNSGNTIDMNTLRDCSKAIIDKQMQQSTPSAPTNIETTFKEIIRQLPEKLKENVAMESSEQITVAIGFNTVLQLAFENNLELEQKDTLDDFIIRKHVDENTV